MFWYILGNTPYYSLIFILCFFLTHERLKTFCVAIIGLMLIDQSSNPYILANHEEWFFEIKALLDLCWIVLSIFMCKGFKYITPTCGVSLLINIYLCIDTTNNIVYQYWNEINFFLFEIIIFIIISNSPYVKRFNSWLYKVATDMTNK